MSQSRFDTSIPLLTEVLAGSADDSAAIADTGTSAFAAPHVVEVDIAATRVANYGMHAGRAELDVTNVAALEQRLVERILLQLQDRVDSMLEVGVRDVLAEVVRQSVDQLSRDLRVGLQQSMRHMVTQAISQELARLQLLGVP